MEENLRALIRERFPGKEVDLRTYSPLTLAFLGDAVYSLIIRTVVVEQGNRQAEKLHNDTVNYVRAGYQARLGRAMYDLLTPQEQKIYRRGRNANPMHHARGATYEEYLQATAFETLCGYLYLTDSMDRLLDLLRDGVKQMEQRGIEVE